MWSQCLNILIFVKVGKKYGWQSSPILTGALTCRPIDLSHTLNKLIQPNIKKKATEMFHPSYPEVIAAAGINIRKNDPVIF